MPEDRYWTRGGSDPCCSYTNCTCGPSWQVTSDGKHWDRNAEDGRGNRNNSPHGYRCARCGSGNASIGGWCLSCANPGW